MIKNKKLNLLLVVLGGIFLLIILSVNKKDESNINIETADEILENEQEIAKTEITNNQMELPAISYEKTAAGNSNDESCADLESIPLFDGFGEMDYALFLETGVGYPESAIIPTYGIYGDFTERAEDGTDIYVALNNNIIGKEIPISTISDLNYWNQYTEEHIVNVSQDLDWIVSRQFDYGLGDVFYCENWYAGGSIVKKLEGNLSMSIGDFLFSKNLRENISQIQQKNDQIQNLLNDLYQEQIGEHERTWFCLDESGKILAVRTKENESEKECIRIYNVSGDQAKMLYQFSAPETGVNWDIEISQIAGDEKNGWVVFSAGPATYRLQYPEGVTEKIGEFMYSTTYSPDEKYRAFCTGNIDLYDSWQSMYKESDYDEELLVQYREMRSRWDTVPAGWYVEELETGNKTYIPIKPYVPINHVLPSIGYGRCIWIDKKKLFEILPIHALQSLVGAKTLSSL